MRHKPEIKYTQSKQHIESLVDLQLEILENVKQCKNRWRNHLFNMYNRATRK